MTVARIPGGGVARNPFGVQWTGAEAANEAHAATDKDPLFARPRPALVEPDPETAALLGRLHPFRRRLARLAGDAEDDYALALAHGTIAMIDEHGTIYVGRDFLVGLADDLDVQVGVIAHEIGHRPSRWREYRKEHRLTRAELDDLCRLEETRADYFAGYGLGHLGFACEPLCEFLAAVEEGPHPQYFSAELRGDTIREGYGAGTRRARNTRKFFPEFARHASIALDLGSG